MAESIFMRIGESRVVELDDLSTAIVNFLGLLRDVDATISDKRNGYLKWRVTMLRDDPFPVVGVMPFLPKATQRDISFEVEKEVIGNVGSLTESGERSRFLSDAALGKVERIAKTAPKIGASQIYTSESGEFKLLTRVTTKTLSQIQELTNAKSVALGTVIGSLDSISVHKGREFRVWDEAMKKPIRCQFKQNQELQAKELLGRRVVVTGTIRSNRYGRPLSMVVHSFNEAPLQDLPPVGELMGSIPNFTGGLSMAEYFEDLH